MCGLCRGYVRDRVPSVKEDAGWWIVVLGRVDCQCHMRKAEQSITNDDDVRGDSAGSVLPLHCRWVLYNSV